VTIFVPNTQEPQTNEHWYALYTKSRHERLVKDILESRHIEVFLPVIKSVHPRRATSQAERPFFPRYLFGHMDLERVPLSSINWMPGMAALVCFDGRPATVPDSVVHWLRDSLGRLDGSGFFGSEPLQSGDLLRVTAGPLKGMEAVFDRRLTDEGRVRVLVQMLGRMAACEVDLDCLERA